MTRIMRIAVGVLLASAAFAAERFTEKQLAAKFYYDLGPDTVDVSGYPKAQRENYAVFAKTCSQCHTLARPINAPIASKEDWRRYVTRMYLRTKVRPGSSITKEQAKAAVDFLAFDANIRKRDGKAAFDAETERLKKEFEELKAARSRRQIENDQKKVKPASDNTAPKPRP